MIVFLIYLLKVSASMLGLFIMYYLLLRHHTFHQVNRICLLTIISFSFVVPVVPASTESNPIVPIVFETNDYYGNDWTDVGKKPQDEPSTNAADVLSLVTAIYLLGVVAFSCRLLKSLVTLCKLGRKTSIEIHKGFRIGRTDLKASFTFLNTIFLPKAETDPIILKHEQAHVSQFHWIDLLVAEIAAIVLWFNPVMVLLKHELRLQHEFMADRSVMANGVSFKDYAQCLVNNLSSGVTGINPISPMHSTSFKKRILMMTKTKTSACNYLFYLLMIPLCAIMLMSFGRKPQAPQAEIVLQAESRAAQDTPDISPVDLTKVTKVVLYGEMMDHRTNKLRNHSGIDLVLSKGSDVVATADGIVVRQTYGEKRGNHVIIKHNDTFSSRYFHLETAFVKHGDRIKKGQVIGLVGNTGLSSAPHLHYEVLKNDAVVDPQDYLPTLPGL